MPKRVPAIKTRIKDLVGGKFFPGNKEQLKPSYVITRYGIKVSRANVVGTVTDKFVNEAEDYMSLSIDDGTASIRVKLFREMVEKFKDIEVGDLVLVIGKVKRYLDEIYINGEIIRRITDPNYETYRKLELIKQIKEAKKIVEELKRLRNETSEEEFEQIAKERYNLDKESLEAILEAEKEERDLKPMVLKLIEELDEGEGVEAMKLFDVLNASEVSIESAITNLLNEGYIYEPEPGKFKRVKA